MSDIDPQAKWTSTAILSVCAALITVGVVMIASASASLDRSIFGPSFWRAPWGRQVLFAALGFGAMVISAWIGQRVVHWSARRRSWMAALLLIVCVGALVAVLVPGIGAARHGARRWIRFGPEEYGFGFQPSELAKLALVVGLAVLLSRPAKRVRSLPFGLLPAGLLVGLIAGLVGLEDFGTAALLAAVGGLMLIVGGCRLWQVGLAAVPGAAALAYLLLSQEYRVKRLMSFLDIWSDPRGAGYHPIQSLATIASGGWFGRGLGGGVQKYGYLPESRTDFIFSVICEETGVFGGAAVILLFAVLVLLGARAVSRAPNAFARMLAFGVTLTIGLQAAMNIAVVSVCVPTKGIALPLVSAGGSGVVFLGCAVGLLAGVASAGDCPEVREPRPNSFVRGHSAPRTRPA
jgi:cell division protein FtsW